MLSYGKSLLTHNTIDTFADIAEKVEAITAEDLQEVAQEIMAPERQSQLIYQAQVPEHELL
jgi:predicted Zn-dependent peptidase